MINLIIFAFISGKKFIKLGLEKINWYMEHKIEFNGFSIIDGADGDLSLQEIIKDTLVNFYSQV